MIASMSVAPSTSVGSSGLPSPTTDMLDDDSNKLTMYLHQLAGNYEVEVDAIVKDHCYARPWNWKPENVYVKPVKRLFFSKDLTSDKYRKDKEIDVVDVGRELSIPPLDLAIARNQMDEFQRLASFARLEEDEDWEEKIDKILWSPVQNRIFSRVTRILSSERLARLVKDKSRTEPIFRRTSIDIAARRFRETLASTGWDSRLVQWLHNLLFEHLSQEYLAIYLDILQALKVKIPQLIDKMIVVQPNISSRAGSVTWETLGTLLKRSWDPVAPSLNGSRLKKLPGNPILIIVPCGVTPAISSRLHKWSTQLGLLGKVVTVQNHLGLTAYRMTMLACMDQLVQATRAKIQDVRNDSPGRPIILVGFNTGAALACQVAQMEHVIAVVCIGFPFATVEGRRGTPDDTLMDIRCPVMFIIGQNATLVRPDDLEDLREKMLVETSLVVVGTADDHLRISTSKKILEGITQSMVDRCILDEIGDFVGSILLQPHPLPLRPTLITTTNCDNKSKKESHKRRNSTSSSIESEPNSPIASKSQLTPASSTLSIGTSVASNITSKIGTFNTQSNLTQMGGQHANHSSNLKRKRTTNNQKNQLTDHVKVPRLSGQTNINAENGITLNIGTLASLAPIGPIRLAPTTIGQSASTPSKTCTPKSSTASVRTPKITSTGVPLQSVSKVKTIVPSNKTISNVTSHNYKQVNVSDKSGDAKLMNVFTGGGSQIRVNATSTGEIISTTFKPVASSGTLSNLLQNGKNPATLTNAASSTRLSSASSILLTTNDSPANNVTPFTSSASKATEETGVSGDSQQTMFGSIHSLDMCKSKSAHTSRQGVAFDNDCSYGTSCGNIVIVDNSLHNRGAPSSVIVPLNSQNSGGILSSNKLKISHKSIKAMPRITVNTGNLQKLQQKGRSQGVRNSLANDIDDDLGNILDIPIIFAKDDDNLSNIDKMPAVSQTSQMLIKESQERAKLNSTTKVVLISNKQDKLQQKTQQKLGTTSAQAICPANPSVQNLNHLILQTRSQNSNALANSRAPIESNRAVQSTVKYTKIILAKRNSQPSLSSHQQNNRNERIAIATRNSEDANAPKILTFEKNEYDQLAQKTPTTNVTTSHEDPFVDNILEIEDAIKTNIIERKCISTPAIGTYDQSISTTATLDINDCDILEEIKLHEKERDISEQSFDNANKTQL